MSLEFRIVEPDEYAAWVRAATRGFQNHRTDDEVAFAVEGMSGSVFRAAATSDQGPEARRSPGLIFV